MVSLEISRTDTKIGMQSTPGKMEIKTQKAEFEIEVEKPKIKITGEQPQVIIDQSASFSSAGLKKINEVVKEYAQKGISSALEYVGKASTEGAQLSAIENSGNPIASIAKQNIQTTGSFSFGVIPTVRPQIDFKGETKVDIDPVENVIRNGVSFNVTPGEVKIQHTPAQIRIFVQQYASLNFRYLPDKKVDIRL